MTEPKTILYAEDDENDVFLMERAFRMLQIANPLELVTDGKAAMAFLAGTTPYENRKVPGLLLLDLSMPGKHGLEILKWLKTQPALTDLPVIVLTSSNQESDIHRSYLLGAQGYIIKPGDPNELLRIVKMIKEYWLSDYRPLVKFLDYSKGLTIPPPKNGSKVPGGGADT